MYLKIEQKNSKRSDHVADDVSPSFGRAKYYQVEH